MVNIQNFFTVYPGKLILELTPFKEIQYGEYRPLIHSFYVLIKELSTKKLMSLRIKLLVELL